MISRVETINSIHAIHMRNLYIEHSLLNTPPRISPTLAAGGLSRVSLKCWHVCFYLYFCSSLAVWSPLRMGSALTKAARSCKGDWCPTEFLIPMIILEVKQCTIKYDTVTHNIIPPFPPRSLFEIGVNLRTSEFETQ